MSLLTIIMFHLRYYKKNSYVNHAHFINFYLIQFISRHVNSGDISMYSYVFNVYCTLFLSADIILTWYTHFEDTLLFKKKIYFTLDFSILIFVGTALSEKFIYVIFFFSEIIFRSKIFIVQINKCVSFLDQI